MKIVKVFANVLEAICIILFLMTFGFVIFQIICRFVGLTQFVWIDEIIQLCIVWEVFLGCSYLAIRNEHIVVTVVQDLLKDIPLRISEVLVQIINLFAGISLFYGGYIWACGTLKNSAILQWPMRIWYMSVPVSGAILCIAAVFRLIEVVKCPIRKESVKHE